AAAVVADLGRPVLVQRHLDLRAVAAESLVDRVVEDLPQAVHQAAAVGGADVHAGALADGVQAFEHGKVARRLAVGGGHDGGGGGGLGSQGGSPQEGGGRKTVARRQSSRTHRQPQAATPSDTEGDL